MNAVIKKATVENAKTVAELAIQMWKSHSIEELTNEFCDYINQGCGVVFLTIVEGRAIGFAQCGLRHDYVEGTKTSPVGYLEGIFVAEEYRNRGLAKNMEKACETSPVGYLEGIFVAEEYRNRGLAKNMEKACEKWAKEQGCVEFASDCEWNNIDSWKFHLKMGFEEANRIICFRKKLGDSAIGKMVTVTVDRPLGSYHPKYKNMCYPINYGYVKGIIAADGKEQDAYILGVKEAVAEFTGKIIAVVHRFDDVEEKWVVVPEHMSFSREEIQKQVQFQEKFFQSEIVM